MPSGDRVCTEVLNEIISRYSKTKFEKMSGSDEEPQVETEPLESEDEFWRWFCSEMKDSSFKKCLEISTREDFYGALKSVREEYKSRCKQADPKL